MMNDLEQTNETRSMMKGSYQDNKLDKSNELNESMTIKETSKDEYEDLKLKLKESFEVKCDKMCLLKVNMYSTHSNWIFTIESNNEWNGEEIIKTRKEINDKIKEVDKKSKIEEIENVLEQKKNKTNEDKTNKYKRSSSC